jgi:DNA integrity scanning protein DisA with diadenylate cyclase activity
MAKQVDVAAHKLAVKLGDADLAERLVKAGFRNPQTIRNAEDKALEAVPGIGKAKREKIREKLPKAK